MENRRTIILIAAAAAVTFGGVYMLAAPATTTRVPGAMALPGEGGPTRVALARARTDALNASNEAPPVSKVEPEPEPEPYYANCRAVHAARAAPLDAGDPGYRAALDPESDGTAC